MEYCVLNAQYVICAVWGLIKPKQKSMWSQEPFSSLLNNHHCGWKSVKVNQAEMFMDDDFFFFFQISHPSVILHNIWLQSTDFFFPHSKGYLPTQSTCH